MAEAPSPRRTDPDPPSAQEAAALLNEAWTDPEWGLLLWLTMVTGSRRGEVSAFAGDTSTLTVPPCGFTAATPRPWLGSGRRRPRPGSGGRSRLTPKRSLCSPSITSCVRSAVTLWDVRSTPTHSCSPPRPTAPSHMRPERSRSDTVEWRSSSSCAAHGCTRFATTRRRSWSRLASISAPSPADSDTGAVVRPRLRSIRHGSTRPTGAPRRRSPASCRNPFPSSGRADPTRRSPPPSARPSRRAASSPEISCLPSSSSPRRTRSQSALRTARWHY